MTNQASEELINAFIKKWAGEHAAHLLDNDDNDGERLRQAIEGLIRTEKLKLLAEVRERIVGKDESLTGHELNPTKAISLSARNKQRTEQRAELTKLEAEL